MRIMPALRINATASAAVLSAPRRTLCTSSRMMSSDAIEALRAQLKVEMEHEEDRKPTLPTTIGDYTVRMGGMELASQTSIILPNVLAPPTFTGQDPDWLPRDCAAGHQGQL